MLRVPDKDLQPVCSGNHYNFDTGECKFFEDEEKKLGQCSRYPHCMLKVGEPMLRIKSDKK